eukprot:COSAG03_NODE_770_length_5927_cov_6.699039_2_plen_97_part_00
MRIASFFASGAVYVNESLSLCIASSSLIPLRRYCTILPAHSHSRVGLPALLTLSRSTRPLNSLSISTLSDLICLTYPPFDLASPTSSTSTYGAAPA